ncbi:GAF domain-containing protein [Roseibium sp. CAU 1637]|uniref:histidine kinase n=1 Tax=Roseibium limicola TaxID=2816037 RepID=A0A939EL36_9HYPH|nr:HWE histidine kinase domain-containing protein [Roseibium limicola]MBO0344680.1 GAF domain-containing protein [Roseibium limicola]
MQTVDLESCEREPIHQLGGVQAFGCLFAFSNDWLLSHVSENVPKFVDQTVDDLLGMPAADLFASDCLHEIRSRLQWLQFTDASERLFGVDVFGDGRSFDIALHKSEDLIIIEIELSDASGRMEAMSVVRSMMNRLVEGGTFSKFLQQAARQVRFVTDFDRVMVYRFLPDGSGEVVAEARAPQVDSFLGLRYPAYDIPPQARALYLRNHFRIIADVNGEVSKLVPEFRYDGRPLDLSLSVSRSVSEIHLEYLRNMGVQASLSISIIVDGKLWGLFACHHYEPKLIRFDRRTAAELFSQMFSREVAKREQDELLAVEAQARELHDRIMAGISVEGSVFDNLKGYLEPFMDVVGCDGVGILIDENYASIGLSASSEEVTSLRKLLNRSAASKVFSSHKLSSLLGESDFTLRIPGVLAIPVSRRPRDYLLFFRGEVVQSVTWGGNPEKSVEYGPNGARLTPRKSFEAWKENVTGQAEHWSKSDLKITEIIRTTLLEVILRSVDANDRLHQQANQRQDTLIAELNHRVRNILTLIQGVISQSRHNARDLDHFTSTVNGRIKALARAHDQITQANWAPGALRDLLENEVRAYSDTLDLQVELVGVNVMLAPQAFSTVALVMHEMVTNAAKYGALSVPEGKLRISWVLETDGAVSIAWLESNGPAVTPPRRRGFGSTIIEHSVPHELQGESQINYPAEGVRASFKLPAAYCELGDASESPKLSIEDLPSPKVISVGARKSKVLLVEDNVIIAMDGEDMLREIGFKEIILANNVSSALNAIEANEFDLAILDINLGKETSFPVAELLLKMQVPFIFASGYDDTSLMDKNNFEDVPLLSKPFSKQSLVEALGSEMDLDD